LSWVVAAFPFCGSLSWRLEPVSKQADVP
jgi:hypothetical protein